MNTKINTNVPLEAVPANKPKFVELFKKEIHKNWQLYLMVLPMIVLMVLFHYAPMYGIQIAFKNFNSKLGIWKSEWIGFKHITTFIQSPYFFRLIYNSVILNVYHLIFGFPVPILLALIINEIRGKMYKKTIQTIICLPHFISLVVMVGILFLFTSESRGVINNIISAFGGGRIAFMANENWFRRIYVISGIWQDSGWSSIIFVAALAGIDPQMHEAAIIDGASRLQRIWSINLPTIRPTIVITLLLNLGYIMSSSFEKAYLMQLPLNMNVSEVIATYVYKVGFESGSFSYAAAIGLFINIINLLFLTTFNFISKKVGDTSLW